MLVFKKEGSRISLRSPAAGEIKSMKISELHPLYCDNLPDKLKEGIIYISSKYSIAVHLCACGCLEETVTELKPNWKLGWALVDECGEITLRPSIGNFNGEKIYHAHYYVTKNKIEWL